MILKKYLEKQVENDRFNMSYWWEKDECGTVGCAMGHACFVPAFRKDGLYLDRLHQPRLKGLRYERVDGRVLVSPLTTGAVFFGLTEEEARSLFLPTSYGMPWIEITPIVVARRIGELVEGFLEQAKKK